MEQNNDLAMGYVMGRDNNAYGGGNGFGAFGNDWLAIIVILALLGGNGFGWGGNAGGGNQVGYELGKLATTNDVASGFSTSAIMSDLNDILLGQTQGFAAVQQTLCQGFNGIQQTVMQGFHGVDNAICNLGYQTQNGFNGISRQISDCCCDLKQMNLENRYLNEKQTCEIVGAINAGNQKLFDYFTYKENQDLRDKLQFANNKISQMEQNSFFAANQEAQTAQLLRRLGRDCPTAAFIVPNPNCCYNYNVNGVGYGQGGCGNCCG